MNLIKRRNTLPAKKKVSKTKGAILGALLGTTVMFPARANAMPPVVSFAISAYYASVTAFATFAVGLGVSAGTALTFGAFATQLVIGLSLAALVRSLAPRIQLPEPAARMVNFAQPISYMETVYGQVRKGGPIAYTNYGDAARDVVIILAAHQIEGYVQHWLDEWPVIVSIAGFPLINPLPEGTVTTTPPGSLGRIVTRNGTNPQDPLPLVSKYSELTNSHDFAGMAVAQVTAKKPKAEDFSENYPRGREWVYAPVIRGKNTIWDPRDETYKYTDNAALVIADWITTVMERQVNWEKVAIEADIADQDIPKKGGGTQKRWTLNGVISDQEEDDLSRAQLGASCDAFFYETPDGEVGFVLGRYIEPTVTLTENDFYSMTVSEGALPSEAPTEVVVTYVEPANAYRQAPSGAWIIDPDARRIREEIATYFINNHNQAIRIAKRLARTRYSQYKITGTTKYVGNKIMGERFVHVVHSELGIDAVFEVDKLVRNEDGLAYEINLISVTEEDFAFDPDLEEPAQPAYGDTTPVIDDDRPTNISAIRSSIGGSPGLLVSWTAARDILAHRVRWAPNGTEDWQYSEIIQAGQNSYEITPLNDLAAYIIQVQAVSGVSGAPFSTYEPDPPILALTLLNTTPPDNLQSFSLTLAGSDITVDFVAPNDPNYYATRIYRGTTNVFGDAVVIQTEYGAPNAADSYVDTGLSAGTYYYWGEPINSSGVAASASGPQSETVI